MNKSVRIALIVAAAMTCNGSVLVAAAGVGAALHDEAAGRASASNPRAKWREGEDHDAVGALSSPA